MFDRSGTEGFQLTAEGNALHSAWFGSGANLKRKALTKAIQYAEVA